MKTNINKVVMLPIVLYGCEPRSFTLGDTHISVGIKVLSKILEPKREEITR
jgi:hypothetical protein